MRGPSAADGKPDLLNSSRLGERALALWRLPRRSILVFLALAAVLVVGLVGWATRVPVVPAASVRAAPLVRTLQFSGRVATLSRVDVGSTMTGRVLEVAVAEGAHVTKGEALVRLESAELRAALEQAQASERPAPSPSVWRMRNIEPGHRYAPASPRRPSCRGWHRPARIRRRASIDRPSPSPTRWPRRREPMPRAVA